MKILKKIILPNSLSFIEEDTFSNFDNLTDIQKIHVELKWYKYFKIEKITLPDEITILKREIFSNTKYLKHVKLHKKVKELEENAFENSGIENIEIPESVEIIPKYVFIKLYNINKNSFTKNYKNNITFFIY